MGKASVERDERNPALNEVRYAESKAGMGEEIPKKCAREHEGLTEIRQGKSATLRDDG